MHWYTFFTRQWPHIRHWLVARRSLFTPGHVEQALWCLFLATFAWQTRIILWRADVMFSEWRSIAVYASDALMAVLFGVALARGWKPRIAGYDRLMLGCIGVAVLSLTHTDLMTVSIYQLIRLIQFFVLYLYVKSWVVPHGDADTAGAFFVAGALMQSVLGITQYVLQRDVGIRWIGETLLGTDMRGVAVFYDLAQVKILRAYGTLPHPNILAAYLILASWVFAWLYLRHDTRRYRAVWAGAGALLLVGLYLTYSRTMIAAWVLASAGIVASVMTPRISHAWQNIMPIRARMKAILVFVAFVSVIFSVCQWHRIVARMSISSDDEAVHMRILYNKDAASSGSGSALSLNWTGVGIGNFTTWLSGYDKSLQRFQYQPVHNVFLLVYSELGILGFVLWSAWLIFLGYALWQFRTNQPLLRVGLMAVFGALLFIALFDHFFWTLQQGRILWWMTLALVAGISERYHERS